MGKVIAENRKASFNYQLLDKFEAGIALLGPEVKSVRGSGVNLADSFVKVSSGEAVLLNAHISPYKQDTQNSFESKRTRKLLLKKHEIKKMQIAIAEKGLTIVPTKMYLNDAGLIKVEIAIAKGKHTYDKKETLKQRDIDREAKRTIAQIK